MSEDQTRRLTTDEKLDLILTRLEKIETRLDKLETGHEALRAEFAEFRAFVEPKLYDTKPIWEQALAEILEVKNRVGGVEKEMRRMNRNIGELSLESIDVRSRVRDLERQADELDGPRQ